MTAINFRRVQTTETVVTSTPAVPTITDYGQWYSCGKAAWTANQGDKIKVTMWVVFSITGVTSAGADSLAVDVRTRLRDVTTGQDVKAGISTVQAFRTLGSAQFGQLNQVVSFNEVLYEADDTINTHQYELHLELMKEKAIGNPTCTITIQDSTAFSLLGGSIQF